jgi:hypothetical protein
MLKHCCERRIIVLISLLHAQQDALTQYKDVCAVSLWHMLQCHVQNELSGRRR